MTQGRELDVAARSCRFHVERWGSATAPLVLGVPGLTGTMKSFASLGERVGSADLQLVALDLRGRGRSDTTAPGTYGWRNHALDVLGIADALGVERFAIVGQSMGGSVAMQAAALDPDRLTAVVLVDVAGRVDPGVGAVVATSIGRLDRSYESVEHYLDVVRSQGLVPDWSEHWDRAYRYDVHEVDGRTVPRVSALAVGEDRAYTATQDPYDRWRHLTMPTLLLRATRELRPGAGFVVPPAERDRFRRAVLHAEVVEIDATHLTINADPDAAAAVHRFLSDHVSGRASAMSSSAARGLTGMEDDRATATTTIDADAEAVFAVLADPSTHAAIDGTGWVRAPLDDDRITAAGQVFRMAMYHPNHPDKDYRMANRVEVFDEPRAIVWQPGQESPETEELTVGGWVWRYDLEATAPSQTTVTLTYDWSAVPPEVREQIQFPPFGQDHLDRSLQHLADLVR